MAIFLSDIPRHVIVCKIGIFSCAKFGAVNEQLFEKEFHWIYVKSSHFLNVTVSLTWKKRFLMAKKDFSVSISAKCFNQIEILNQIKVAISTDQKCWLSFIVVKCAKNRKMCKKSLIEVNSKKVFFFTFDFSLI